MAFLSSLVRGLILLMFMSIAVGLLAEVSKGAPDLALEAARRSGCRSVRLDEMATGTGEYVAP